MYAVGEVALVDAEEDCWHLLWLLSAGEGVGRLTASLSGSQSTSLSSDCDLQNTMQCTNVTKYNEKIYKCNSIGCYLHRKQINTDIWYYILHKNIRKIIIHKQNNWIGGNIPSVWSVKKTSWFLHNQLDEWFAEILPFLTTYSMSVMMKVEAR